MEHGWASLREGTIGADQRDAAEGAGIIPSKEEMLRQVRAAADAAGDSSLLEGLAVQLPPLPPPTAEMEAAADARVAEERRRWDAEVVRFRANAPGD
jgi:hypothetical protein